MNFCFNSNYPSLLGRFEQAAGGVACPTLSIQLNHKQLASPGDEVELYGGECLAGGDSMADLKERLPDISLLSKELESCGAEVDEEDGEEESDGVGDDEGERGHRVCRREVDFAFRGSLCFGEVCISYESI